MPLSELKNYPTLETPIPVVITGTTFGNELQTKILTGIRIQCILLGYLCIFFTTRWFYQGL